MKSECLIIYFTDAECPSENDPAHGKVQNDKLTYGGNLIYSCNAGYELKGNEKRTCGSDRKWSGEAPTCEQGDVSADSSLVARFNICENK